MKKLLSLSFTILSLILTHQIYAQSACQPCTNPPLRYWGDIYTAQAVGPNWNITYSKLGINNRRKLDLYHALDPANCIRRPLILLLPGSGFVEIPGVDPKLAPNIVSIAQYFSQKGYVVAVTDYHRIQNPYSSDIVFNSVVHEAAQDVHAAIQFLVANANFLNIDTENIFIIGQSAGGIAALSAIFSDIPGNLLSTELSPSNITNPDLQYKSRYTTTDYTIRAFVGISTGTPTIGLFANRVRNQNIPMMFAHGNGDTQVPFGHAFPTIPFFPNFSTTQPFCGSGCITNQIITNGSSQCYKLNEIISTEHDIFKHPFYLLNYSILIRKFFYDQLHCLNCNSYHHTHIPLPVPRLKANIELINQEETSSITIAPNPAKTVIRIGMKEDIPTTVKMYNLSGQLVLSEMIYTQESTVEVSQLVPGIYVVHIEHGDTRHVKEISVQ